MKLKNLLNEVSVVSDVVAILVPGSILFFKNIMELKNYVINGLNKQGLTNLGPEMQNFQINSDADLQEFAQTYMLKMTEFKGGALAALVPHALPTGQPIKKPFQ